MSSPVSPLRPAVFLDRDDTLIRNSDLPTDAFAPSARGDLANPDRVELLPGAASACLELVKAGFVLIVITNQGVVARGGASLEAVHATNRQLCALLPWPKCIPTPPHQHPTMPGDELLARCITLPHTRSLIERVYFCPFHPQGSVKAFTCEHPWRKPAPGMLLAAIEDVGLDIARSWLIGDGQRDIEAGARAGVPHAQLLRIGPDQPFADMHAAARHVLDCAKPSILEQR